MNHLPIPSDEFSWSEWTPLLPTEDLDCIPEEPGVVRVSHTKVSGIHYVGHAEKDLRRRVRRLGYEMRKDEMPYRDPHTAAPCLWAMKNEVGGRFFVSWTGEVPKSKVRGVKDAYITLYRIINSQSPTANFGRMYSGYSKSSGSDVGTQGKKGEAPERKQPVKPPILSLENRAGVTDNNWLGINWSSPTKFRSKRLGGLSYSYPSQPGIFRIWKKDESQLEAVGTTHDLSARIPSLVSRDGSNRLISFKEWGFENESERREIESILVGAHYLATSINPSVIHDEAEELLTLIEKGETEKVEFKRQIPSQADKIVKDILAIANTSGGKLLLGVADEGEIHGVNDEQAVRERIWDLVEGNTFRRIPIKINTVSTEEGDVVVIEIPEAEEHPYSFDGTFYRRSGPQRTSVSGSELSEWFSGK